MENNITVLPTETVFYRYFDTRLKIIKIPRNFRFKYDKFDSLARLQYRVVKVYRSKHEYDCNLYTSNTEIIQDVLNNFEVEEITQPLNETHRELLHKRDRKVVIRNKLWFNRYKHKVTAWHNWDKNTTREDSVKMIHWVYEHFPKGENRIVSTSYGSYFGTINRLAQPPTIFTNSEETMMLYKLAYSDMLRMTMETCITLQELDN
jgi:hypothetical protein